MVRDLVEVGYVAKAHGVAGELRIALHNPESTVLETATRLFVDGRGFAIDRWRPAGKGFLLRLEGVGDRNAADALRGKALSAARAELDLDDDEVLLSDFVGCDACLEDGTPWGRVVEVLLGPQELLVIHHEGVERLLPLVPEFVLELDVDERRVTVAPPEGLPEAPLEGAEPGKGR